MIHLELVEPDERLFSDWQDLWNQGPNSHPFHHPEWVRASVTSGINRGSFRVLVAREGRDLVGCWAFTGRVMRVAGTGVSDILSPLSMHEKALDEAIDFVRSIGLKCDLHQQISIPSELIQAKSFQKSLAPTMDETLKTISKSVRQDVLKGFKNSDLSVEWCQSPEDRVNWYSGFVDLHRKRWRTRKLPGGFVGSRIASFHRTALHQCDALIPGRLWQGDDLVGAVYAMRAGTTIYFYQTGFDPAFSKISPGTMLLAHTAKLGIELGCTSLDLLRGEEPYKLRWKPENSRAHHRVLVNISQPATVFVRATHAIEVKIREKLEAGKKP